MGKAMELSCSCGYQKRVLTGEGMMAANLMKIRKEFAGADLAGFEEAAAAGAKYAMGSKIAYCAGCRELVSAPELRYAKGGETRTITKPCPACGGNLEPRESAGPCPKCGKPLSERQTGLWD